MDVFRTMTVIMTPKQKPISVINSKLAVIWRQNVIFGIALEQDWGSDLQTDRPCSSVDYLVHTCLRLYVTNQHTDGLSAINL